MVFLSCLAVFALGCQKDRVEDIVGGEGEESCAVSFKLHTEQTLDVVALTRSVDIPADNDFMVRIENTKGEVLKTWTYDKLPSLIHVVPGAYKLVGWYGADSVLPAFQKPYYYGERKITLKEGDNLDTVVNCAPAAVKMIVEFDKSFGYEYDDYSVDVKTTGDSLRFEKGEVRPAYFKPGNLRLRFLLRPIGSDIVYEFYPQAIGTVKAKQFYKMKLKANTEKGELKSVTVITDSSTIDIPVEVELPPFYLPKAAPRVTPQGFVSGDVVATTEGMSKAATVLVSASAGLTELKIKTISDTLIARGWPAEFDLMKATAEQLVILKANGLEWSDALVKQDTIKTTVFVRFDNVVKLLNTAPGGTANSTFEVLVKDRFNQVGDAECKLNVSVAPPVFGFKDGSPVEGNLFAKKAVFNLVYTADREGYVPTVEYKIPGGEWLDVSEISGNTSGMCKALVQGLASNRDYVFRSVLREHVTPEFQLKTETELQLPNKGLESWSYTSGNKDWWRKWFPWNDESSKGWNTINELTTSDAGGITTQYAYVSNSGTIQTTDKYSGSFAAIVRTIGWGAGTTAPGNAWVTQWDGEMKRTDPGFLYLGGYTATPENAETVTPLGFNSRPDAVSFYYKYSPAKGKEQSDDKYVVTVVVENRTEGNIIKLAEARIEEGGYTTSYTLKTIPLTYTDFEHRATHIYVMFKSGHVTEYKYFKVPPQNNLSNGQYIGSEFYIDNIELVY